MTCLNQEGGWVGFNFFHKNFPLLKSFKSSFQFEYWMLSYWKHDWYKIGYINTKQPLECSNKNNKNAKKDVTN